jgi:cGMP-dependent protein kinase
MEGDFQVAEVTRGDSFGELALIQPMVRASSLKAISTAKLWGIDRGTFRECLEGLNCQVYKENRRFLENVPIFEVLNYEQREALILAMSEVKYAAGQKIIQEGDPGDLFYLIKQGVVVCSKDGLEVRRMTSGEFFGEQALLYNCKRTATVTAVEASVKCLVIGRDMLASVIGTQLQDVIYMNSMRIAIEANSHLQRLNSEQVQAVIDKLTVTSYSDGELVVTAGTRLGQTLWIVLYGELINSTESLRIGKLVCLGDDEIVNGIAVTLEDDFVANGDCDIAIISKESLEACIGFPLAKMAGNNEALKVLRQIDLLRSLSNDRLKSLVMALDIEVFDTRALIFQENTPSDKVYIIKEGGVEIVKQDSVLRSLSALACFGERSMLLSESRTASAVTTMPTTCWVLRRDDFFNIIDERMSSALIARLDLQDESTSLDDLVMVKALGEGMLGRVYLAAHRRKRCLYAVKVVSKKRVEAAGCCPNIVLERQLLLQVDHSFIVKLVKTFKDEERLYFLMEYVRGADMFDVIRGLGLLPDKHAKFYTACILIILEHLGDRSIIYRDLKPENIMVDDEVSYRQGYPKLIDFGTAKIVKGRTFTVIGTPHYMAPEVITGKGYSKLADLWSLGIMLYEFVCGLLPFGEDEVDPYAVYECILNEGVEYPPFVAGKLKSEMMIEQLLHRNPAMRTGGCMQRLKSHKWLRDVNWDRLISREEQPPHKPQLASLNAEVIKAMESRRTLKERIVEEQAENPPPRISILTSRVSPGWDDEF